MDEFTTLRVHVGGPVGAITLARPARLNAIDATMLEELVVAAAVLDDARDVRCVVVSGQGRAFSAGADLALIAQLSEGDDVAARARADLGRVMADAVEGMRAVTVAAIHDWCVGGGLVLAAACDLRIAAEGTRFSIPEVDLGIPLAWGGIPRLVREIGPARTKELVMTGREFSAVEAREAGFLNDVVAADALLDRARTLAGTIAAKPRLAVEPTKRHVNAVTAQMVGLSHSWSDADGMLTAVHDHEAAAARAEYLRVRRG